MKPVYLLILSLLPTCVATFAHAAEISSTAPSTTTAPARLPALPRVTIVEPAMSPQDAFAEFMRQTGVNIEPRDAGLWTSEGRPGAMNVDIRDAEFWPAMAALCRLANVVPNPREDGVIVLDPSSNGLLWGFGLPIHTDGPVLMVITQTMEMRTVQLAQPGTLRRRFAVHIDCFIDPRVRGVPGKAPIRIEAVDDDGHPFTQLDPKQRSSGGGGWRWNFNPILRPATREVGQRLATVKGSVTFLISGKIDPWDVPDPNAANPPSRRVNGFEVIITGAKRQERGFAVELQVNRRGRDAEQFAQVTAAMSDWMRDLRVNDAGGDRLETNGWGSHGSKDTFEMSIRYHPPGGEGAAVKEPVKIVWPLPTAVREVTYPFEFKDVALP